MATEQLLEISEKSVELSLEKGADQAQVMTFLLNNALTKYSNSQIDQNVAFKIGGITIKVVMDKKIGAVRLNTLEEKRIRNATKQAVNIAKVTQPNKDFKSLPGPEEWTPIENRLRREYSYLQPRLSCRKG